MNLARLETPGSAATFLRGAVVIGLLLTTFWSAYYMVWLAEHEPAMSWSQFGVRLVRTFGYDLLMMAPPTLLVWAGQRRLPPQPTRRWAVALLLVLVAGGTGFAVCWWNFSARVPDEQMNLWYARKILFWQVCMAAGLLLFLEFAQRSRQASTALHELELRRLSLQRELADAQLQLLQAQVEPHFIFNSLANLRRLLRTDPPAARAMLGDLLRYLREALPRLRAEQTTLGSEAELVRAFLAVYQVRMGERLRAVVEVPEQLASRSVPPMMLLTLVENALKHGLQPLVEGGSIVVVARVEGAALSLSVADTGRGMGIGSGHGTGLANIRARLVAIYGSAASLSLQVNQPRGVVATIRLPELAR